ncbi:outer membrane lipoprotein carrier protein LolA, partial [Acinetobacter baumannii]|nr:outer membrane lipoprotein carrier protein LolA [Acinetobacter baumannii]
MNMLRKTMCAITLSASVLAPVMSTTAFAAPVAAPEQQAIGNLVNQLSGLQRMSADF